MAENTTAAKKAAAKKAASTKAAKTEAPASEPDVKDEAPKAEPETEAKDDATEAATPAAPLTAPQASAPTNDDEAAERAAESGRPDDDDPTVNASLRRADENDGAENEGGGLRGAAAGGGAQTVPAGAYDSGPGTGTVAPDEGPRQYAQRMQVPLGVGAAPIESPDVATQTVPLLGKPASSTDHAYAIVGGQSIAGESVEGLYLDNGTKAKVGDLFDVAPDGQPFVLVKQNINEKFRYPNTTTVCERRLLAIGQKVTRDHAQRIKDVVVANSAVAPTV